MIAAAIANAGINQPRAAALAQPSRAADALAAPIPASATKAAPASPERGTASRAAATDAVPATSNTTTPTQATSQAASAVADAAGARLSGTFGDFLTLLTTQLRNQDPLTPLDTNQFTSQLVQFAGVEQALATNQHLSTLIGLERGNQLAALGAFLGRRIEAETDRLPLMGGQAGFVYDGSGEAQSVRITIRDAAGRVVIDSQGAAGAGRQEFQWDGRDAAGRQLPDGAYSVGVTEIRANNATRSLPVRVIAAATGAVAAASSPELILGPVQVPLSAVRAVLAPLAPPAT
ncbi:MAG: flagellar hook assembly protein FlgD [Alphaproteobacteria bacterium]|nr:flagellar hook assembly protein FlgD [Alphaproteobacteria bacterium]